MAYPGPPPGPPGWGPPPGGAPPAGPYAPPQHDPVPYDPRQPPPVQAVDYIAPVNVKNWLAFASGWLGILSLCCLGPITGVPAIITGVMALQKPHLGGKGRAWTGIVLGGLTTIFWVAFFALRPNR